MKIRKGFVSNSSSSSFMMYGICVESLDRLPRFAGKEITWQDEDDFEKQLISSGLELRQPGESRYIGRSWCKVADNQTGAEFKKRVEELISEVTGIQNPQCSTLEMAWYNG